MGDGLVIEDALFDKEPDSANEKPVILTTQFREWCPLFDGFKCYHPKAVKSSCIEGSGQCPLFTFPVLVKRKAGA